MSWNMSLPLVWEHRGGRMCTWLLIYTEAGILLANVGQTCRVHVSKWGRVTPPPSLYWCPRDVGHLESALSPKRPLVPLQATSVLNSLRLQILTEKQPFLLLWWLVEMLGPSLPLWRIRIVTGLVSKDETVMWQTQCTDELAPHTHCTPACSQCSPSMFCHTFYFNVSLGQIAFSLSL